MSVIGDVQTITNAFYDKIGVSIVSGIVPLQNYYVYTLASSLDNMVFYVGKGHGIERMANHEWQAKRGKQSHKCNKIRKIWRDGGTIIRTKVAEFVNEQDAFIYEWALVNLIYGRENLTNRTDGGDGVRGSTTTTHPPRQVENHRKVLREIFSAPERVEQQRQISQAYWKAHPEEREQYRLKMTDPIERAKCGEANIGNTYNAKTYEDGFQSPSGEIFTNIHNLKAFCEEHHLSAVHMGQVYVGARISHKGWKRYPTIEREVVPTYAKTGFRDPQGQIYEAESIPSLSQFCREHNLQRTCMVHVGNGTLHSHKGWTRYPEIKAERDYHGTYAGPAFQGPDGTIYTTEDIDNLTQFCLVHDLQPSCMSLVGQGKSFSHKGWTRYPPREKLPKFSFRAPDGTVHHSTSLRALCQQHNLNESCMSLLRSGKLQAHQGWTRYEPEQTQQ